MKRVRVTPRALKDLQSIADYSLRSWGERQAAAYVHALDDRFRWLARNPRLGKKRDEVRPGFRSYRQGAHLIFYVIASDEIQIIGVLHISMDIIAQFQ